MGKLFPLKVSVVKQHLALLIRVDVQGMLAPSLCPSSGHGSSPLIIKTLPYNHYDEMSL